MLRNVLLIAAWLVALTAADVFAQEKASQPADKAKVPASQPKGTAKTVEEIARDARQSVVVITYTSRNGGQGGIGSGFVLDAEGLIATNLHVIGEGREITVQMADGRKHPVTAVHASDRKMDLAIIRVDARNLKPLALGDSDTLKIGQAVVAIGNPQGLERSVVSGVVSGRREIDNKKMIQLAIPIEAGNSGGPLLDMQGRVHGLLTMKSLVTNNLGFAVEGNGLKKLMENPNPIPMRRWLTIGALDPQEWTPKYGANWRQRSGRIVVDGFGSGFGGRSFCLSQVEVPEVPYELAVTVKLDDERGAAGVLFHADGGDRHYGFYTSGGRMRLTRFDGPTVNSWTILEQSFTPHYVPGEFNTLKVRIEKDKFLCYVNDHLVIESADKGLTSGKVGVAKFRDTRAEFKSFQVAKTIPPSAVPADVAARIAKLFEGLKERGPLPPKMVDSLLTEGVSSVSVLRARAKLLDQRAAQLRRLAAAVHQQAMVQELAKLFADKEKDEDVDLLKAALLISKLDNDELDVAAYLKEFERMVRELKATIPDKAEERAKIEAINKFLFADRGFHGSRTEYYNKSNSYLNEVLDDREGLPITLSVIYMELAQRAGVNVVGVGLPGHFVVRHEPKEGESQLIDPFERGKFLSKEDAAQMVMLSQRRAVTEDDLKTTTKRAIVERMLLNLLGLAESARDFEARLRYVNGIVAVAAEPGRYRWFRAVWRFQTDRREASLRDVEWLLEHQPTGVDVPRVEELKRILEQPRPQ